MSFDPITNALLMGWLAGKRMAAMRGKEPSVPDVPDVPDEPTGIYDDIVASLEDGVLYIAKAPAKLNDGILEVDMNG